MMGGSTGGGGGCGPDTLRKSQVAIRFIKITRTDPPPPLEKHLDPMGPMASRGGPYGILRKALMTKKLSGPPLIEVSGSVYAVILNKSENATPKSIAMYELAI